MSEAEVAEYKRLLREKLSERARGALTPEDEARFADEQLVIWERLTPEEQTALEGWIDSEVKGEYVGPIPVRSEIPVEPPSEPVQGWEVRQYVGGEVLVDRKPVRAAEGLSAGMTVVVPTQIIRRPSRRARDSSSAVVSSTIPYSR